MQEKSLHILSFDNPFPPKYGGTIEVFYKIKALHEIGFKIYLHCFVNNIPNQSEGLSAICEEVFFYKNSTNPFLLFSRIPYSVISRNSKKLVRNLAKINAPILYEGLKTAYFSDHAMLKNRVKLLRLHNLEQDYFLGLSKSETNWFKKVLYYFESKKFEQYESRLAQFDKVLALSKFENQAIHQKFGNSAYVPVFHGNSKVEAIEGIGKFALYHGDLRTSDNRKVVEYLIDVFKTIDYKLVIASGSAEHFVKKRIGDASNIEFVFLEDFQMLKRLLSEAHINLIFSFQRSGTKLKLLNSLFGSRFCVINENIMDDEVVTQFCHQIDSKEALISKINLLRTLPYTDFENKKDILERYLDDVVNARKIEDILNDLKR